MIVDFHTHVFPDRMRIGSYPKVDQVRKIARSWLRPLAHSLHRSQPWVRLLPEKVRNPIDEVTLLTPLAGLLIESTPRDLSEAMAADEVDRALVIAHPPFLTNEELLEICSENSKLIPAVNIPPGTRGPGQVLRSLAKRGARVLKIHPSADGEALDSARYSALLNSADSLGLPVILHTGCMHSRVIFKDPELGHAERFAKWFEAYPEIRFVLAHMNYHDPKVAMDLAQRYPNLYVDTSWQPSEIIGEAARRIGASRVLFGTDWPLVGNNISVGIERIRDCVDGGTLSAEDAELILGKNAECLLNSPN